MKHLNEGLKFTKVKDISRGQTFKSLPEYPSVMLAIASRSTLGANSSLANITLKIFSLFGASGKLTISLHKIKDGVSCILLYPSLLNQRKRIIK